MKQRGVLTTLLRTSQSRWVENYWDVNIIRIPSDRFFGPKVQQAQLFWRILKVFEWESPFKKYNNSDLKTKKKILKKFNCIQSSIMSLAYFYTLSTHSVLRSLVICISKGILLVECYYHHALAIFIFIIHLFLIRPHKINSTVYSIYTIRRWKSFMSF